MQTLQIFDPAMCCSTGVCGPEVDTKLVHFAADLDWLKSQGVIVQRHNLSQNPAAFVENEAVRTALTEKGESALPLLLVNGKIAATGRYPERSELAAWFELKAIIPNENGEPTDNVELPKPQATACDSGCSCQATGTSGKRSWVIGAIVLVATGVLVARAVIKSGGASSQTTTPVFAELATAPTPAGESGPATNSAVAAQAAETSVRTSIGALADLNTVAAKTDAVFIFLPGKKGASGNNPSTPMKGAVRIVESKGLKCGLFTLKAGSHDYDQIAVQMSVPGVLAMV